VIIRSQKSLWPLTCRCNQNLIGAFRLIEQQNRKGQQSHRAKLIKVVQ
jgi:hypothetical protein